MPGENSWILPVIAGVGIGVLGTMIFNQSAQAAAASTSPTNPATAAVTLAAGAQSAAVAPNGTVTLSLPSGASWAGSSTTGQRQNQNSTTLAITPLASGTAQPTGSQSFNFMPGAASTTVTCNWVDSNGTAQVTTLTVTVG